MRQQLSITCQYIVLVFDNLCMVNSSLSSLRIFGLSHNGDRQFWKLNIFCLSMGLIARL